jgi:hypothetical protein
VRENDEGVLFEAQGKAVSLKCRTDFSSTCALARIESTTCLLRLTESRRRIFLSR